MAVFGYARVSREDQELALQVDALVAAGVEPGRIIKEKISGAAKVRPRFQKLIAQLGEGDTLVAWKVDRLGRSTVDMLRTARELDAKGVRLVFTTLGVDTKTPAGVRRPVSDRRVRARAAHRAHPGWARCRQAARQEAGRKPLLTTMQGRQAARMVEDGMSYGQIGDLMKVSRQVVFKTVRMVKAKAASQEAALDAKDASGQLALAIGKAGKGRQAKQPARQEAA